MHKVSLVALAAMIALGSGSALAQTVPPTTTVNSPQSTNNGVSNPVGQNTNVQVNNSYAGMNSFGVGIECATPYVAAGVYNNNTTVGGGIATAAGANNNSLGGTLQFVVPIGGHQQANCTSLSDEILHQHQLDTKITLIQRCADFAKAGITLDARVYPELAAACAGVHVSASGVGQLPWDPSKPGTTATATAAAAPAPVQTVTVPKLVVYREPAPKPQVVKVACQRWTSPNPLERRMLADLVKTLHKKPSKYQEQLAAKKLAELQSTSCVDPVALIQILADR